MANMYDNAIIVNNNTACSNSSSSPPENDDISRLIHQILRRSSTSTPSPASLSHKMQFISTPFGNFSPENQHRLLPPPSLVSGSTLISAADASVGPHFATTMSTPSVGVIDNDPDEYDCENEEGFEALMEEMPAKTIPRQSSKRSREAEVHNLSEKRRRSRINEKMKALQNLIPNSNKTDKASMLDEAIEYLKQLQLQVQMLTMRNGLSLYPMYVPGALQPNQFSGRRISFQEGNEPSFNLMTNKPPNNSETLTNPVFSLPNQCNNSNQLPSRTNLSNIINSTGPESLIQAQHGPLELHTRSEGFCREAMPCQTLNADPSGTNLGKNLKLEAKAPSSIPFGSQAPRQKDNEAMKVCNHQKA